MKHAQIPMRHSTSSKKPLPLKNILFVEGNMDGTIGGSHYCLLEIVKGLDKNTFKPFVLFYQDNVLVPEFMKYCKVTVVDRTKGFVMEKRLPSLFAFCQKYGALQLTLIFFQRVYNFLIYNTSNFLKVLRSLLRLKIDIVHLNNAPQNSDWLIASKILHVKCVSHLRGNWIPGHFHQRLARYYDTIISISNSVTNFAEAHGLSRDNFVTIYDGIDIETVFKTLKRDAKEIRNEFVLPKHYTFIGVIGNIIPWKGQHVVIQAIKLLATKYQAIVCLIVGDVSTLDADRRYFSHLKALAEENGLGERVIFTGFRNDIADVVNALDVLIHTSVEPEPFGRVILEGMVFSKPIISTAHGGPVEIIEEGISGFLVPPNEPDMLAEKIAYLLTNSDIAKEIGKAGRRRVEECFGLEANIRGIERVYRHLLNL
jgi:glycosyltransferase involved in cell wall biosynthesis